jgi:hypothetical protein
LISSSNPLQTWTQCRLRVPTQTSSISFLYFANARNCDFCSDKRNVHFAFSILCILQRAVFLENDTEMEVAHSVAATAGDTEVFFID